MDQPSVTQQRIAAARNGLADRLCALERKTTDAADEVCFQVKDSVSTVCDGVASVSATISGINSSAQGFADLPEEVRRNVRRYPWTSVGAAVVAGLVAGLMPRRSSAPASRSATGGLWQDLIAVARRELLSLGETALVSGASAVKQSLKTSVDGPHQSNGRNYAENGVG